MTPTAMTGYWVQTEMPLMAGTHGPTCFVRQLEGRLLSALSAEVTQAIFGDDPQDSGTVEFGDTTITFDRTPEAITLDIIDALDGTSTTITVPQLVTTVN